MKKGWCMYIMQYHLATEKKEILLFPTTWVISNRPQTEGAKRCMISHDADSRRAGLTVTGAEGWLLGPGAFREGEMLGKV